MSDIATPSPTKTDRLTYAEPPGAGVTSEAPDAVPATSTTSRRRRSRERRRSTRGTASAGRRGPLTDRRTAGGTRGRRAPSSGSGSARRRPGQSARDSASGAHLGVSVARPRRKSVQRPTPMRYAAPRYFTVSNASADAARRPESPSAAAKTCTSAPVWIPSIDAAPHAPAVDRARDNVEHRGAGHDEQRQGRTAEHGERAGSGITG